MKEAIYFSLANSSTLEENTEMHKELLYIYIFFDIFVFWGPQFLSRSVKIKLRYNSKENIIFTKAFY